MLSDVPPPSICILFLIALEKKLSGYTNVTMLYGPEETHSPPVQGGIPMDRSTNPKRKVLTDPKEVRKFMTKHMQNIYKHQANLTPEAEHVVSFLGSGNDQSVLNSLQSKKLTEIQKQALEGKLSKMELETQLMKHMKNSSAPGIDGFTVAWVKEFWGDLSDICVQAVNDSFDAESLSTLLKTAIMKILRKGEKDPLEAGNYRPISLLSVFYKMASGAITRRLQTVIENVIGIQQKAYSKERNIGSVMINLLNLMDDVNKKKMNCLILSIDFKKAFDSIDHKFIDSCLELLNFGPQFRRWVNLFFKNRETYLLMDGHLSEKISLEQGVPQGDVLSPYIFNIAVEFLLMKITHTRSIEGLTFAKYDCRAETYADDTTIIIKRTEENLRNLIQIIQDFSLISGLHANLDKTSVTPLGNCFSIDPEDQICRDLNLKWVTEFTLLGITFDSKLQNLYQNFEVKILKVESLIVKWKKRNLTVSGRVAIAKAILLSQFVYLLTILDTTTSSICDRIQTLLNNFILGDTKRKWMSEDYIYTRKSQGGLGFIRLSTFVQGLKCAWMKRYICGANDHWAHMLDIRFGVTDEHRAKITLMGNRKLLELSKPKLRCLSEYIEAFSNLTKLFPTDVSTGDNSWISQATFQNGNILCKFPHRNREGNSVGPLVQTYYSLPQDFNCRIFELFSGGKFLQHEQLQELVRTKTQKDDTIVSETTHLMLQRSLKFVTNPRETFENTKVIFPNTLPLLNPKPPKYSSSQTNSFFHKIKKGSSPYRKILDRGISFINSARISAWKKATGLAEVSKETLEKTFKLINHADFPAADNDALVRLYTRKTTFNHQNHKTYPVQTERPEWAHRLNCWACETKLGQFHLETIDHATQSCPCLSNVRKNTLSQFGIEYIPQPTTPTHSLLWGQSYRARTCEKKCDFIGSFFDFAITSEILRVRNKKWADPKSFGNKILEKYGAIMRAKPRCYIALECAALRLIGFNQNVRPPENVNTNAY